MTKDEKKQFCEAWLEAENVITMIEPQFVPKEQLKRPEDSGPEEIKLLLQFLRVLVRLLLHDKESTARENMSLSRLIDQQASTVS